MTIRRNDILEAIRANPDGIGIEKLETILETPRSRRTIQRRLASLIESGVVEKKGSGRNTRYLPVSPVEASTASYRAYIPLSEEALEISTYVSLPLPARTPVSYDRLMLD